MATFLEEIVQKISLDVAAKSLPKGNGLDATIDKLKTIKQYLEGINAAGTKAAAAFGQPRTAQEFTSRIKTKGPHTTEAMAALFGYDVNTIRAAGQRLEQELRAQQQRIARQMEATSQFTPTGRASRAYQSLQRQSDELTRQMFFTSAGAGTFRSTAAAGRFFESFEAQRQAAMQRGQQSFINRIVSGFGGGFAPTSGQLRAGAAAARVAGEIAIPAGQIKIVGDVPIRIIGGASASAGGSGATGGGGGRVGPSGGIPGGSFSPGAGSRELQRVITQKGENVTTAITELQAVGETITRTFDTAGKEIQSKLKLSRTDPMMRDFRTRQANALARARAAVAGAGDPLALAAAREAIAREFADPVGSGIIPQSLAAALQAKGESGVLERFGNQGALLQAQAAAGRQRVKEQFERYNAIMAARGDQYRADVMERMRWGPSMIPMAGGAGGFGGAPPGIIPRPPYREPESNLPESYGREPYKRMGPLDKWLQFTPKNMVRNIGIMAGWSLAMMPVRMIEESMGFLLRKTVEVETEMAKLQMVFRGTGGSAKELTGDILNLAGAKGIDTAAAMQAATGWARLGLSREQVVSATRQTALLSNIGGIEPGTVQGLQQSIAGNFPGLGLNSLSAMLAAGAARTGIPLDELMTGMAKAAPMAGVGGMSPQELMAIVGVGSRLTHDTGMRTGMTMQAVFQALANPETRESLATAFGINTTINGEPRNLSSMWAELARAYNQSSRGRQLELQRIGVGPLRGARLGAYLSGYGEEQTLANYAMSNPNAGAEMERQLSGTVGYAWNRFKAQGAATAFGWGQSPSILTGGMAPAKFIAGGLDLATEAEKEVPRFLNVLAYAIGNFLSGHIVRDYQNIYGWGKGYRGTGQVGNYDWLTNAATTESWLTDFIPGGGWFRRAVGLKDYGTIMAEQAAQERRTAIASFQSPESEQAGLDYMSSRSVVANYEAQRRALIEGPMAMAMALPHTGELGEFLNQRAGLQAQLGALQAAWHGTFDSKQMGPGYDYDAADRLRKQYQEQIIQVQAQLGAMGDNSPEYQVRAFLSRQEVAGSRARAFAAEAGIVGHTPMEQMLNREAAINAEIGRLSSNPNRSDMENARLGELHGELYKTRVEESQRQEQLPYLQKQAEAESRRSFARETLFAGPQELLGRLGAMQISQRGLTPGQFFALSPQMRRWYDELHGGDEGAKLREEGRLAAANPRHMTPEQQAAAQQATQEAQASAAMAASVVGLTKVATAAELAATALAKIAVTVLPTNGSKRTDIVPSVRTQGNPASGGFSPGNLPHPTGKWDGKTWTPAPGEPEGPVRALDMYQGGASSEAINAYLAGQK